MIIKGNKTLSYRILKWKINNNCNYRCVYCFQNHSDWETSNYKSIITHLNRDILKMSIPTVPRLIGGEPTLHSKFNDIINLFKIPFGIYTNLSMSNKQLMKLLQNPYLHHIYCTYHSAFTDFSTFLQKILIISMYNPNVILYVAIMIENTQDFHNILQGLNELNINGYIIPKVIEDNGKIDTEYYANYKLDYTDFLIPQQKIIYNNNIIYRMTNNISNFNLKGCICDINTKQIELTDDYRIKKCLLNEETYDILNIPSKQVCHLDKCHIFTWEFGTKVKV